MKSCSRETGEAKRRELEWKGEKGSAAGLLARHTKRTCSSDEHFPAEGFLHSVHFILPESAGHPKATVSKRVRQSTPQSLTLRVIWILSTFRAEGTEFRRFFAMLFTV